MTTPENEKPIDYDRPPGDGDSSPGSEENGPRSAQPPSQGDFLIQDGQGGGQDPAKELLHMPPNPAEWMGRINGLPPEMGSAYIMLIANDMVLEHGSADWSVMGYYRLIMINSEGERNSRTQYIEALTGHKSNMFKNGLNAVQGMFNRGRGAGQPPGEG